MAKLSDKQLMKYRALREAVEGQRYLVLEIVKSDVRLGDKVSDFLKREVKKLERLEAAQDKVANKVFNL